MNDKLATLLGLLLSDGSVFFDRSKKVYCIQFTNKVKELRNVFEDLMKECFGISKFSYNNCRNAVSVRVFSNKIARFLFTFSPTFRKLPCKSFPQCNEYSCIECSPVMDEDEIEWPPCVVPEEISNEKKFAIDFLRGFASGDGSVYFGKNYKVQIEFTCYQPILREQVATCLKAIGINSWTKKKGVFITSKSELLKFYNMVGFIPESIVCNRKSKWFGLPKNNVLGMALASLC